MPALVLSLIAALGYGVSDFVGGLAARRTAVLRVVLLSYPVGFAGILAVAPLAGGTVTLRSLLAGALAGLVSGCAIVWFYAALASGPMSVVSPLTSLLVAGLPLGVGVLWGERPGPPALAGRRRRGAGQQTGAHDGRRVITRPLHPKSGMAHVRFRRRVRDLLRPTRPGRRRHRPVAARRIEGVGVRAGPGSGPGGRPPQTTHGPTMRLALAAAALDILANATFLYTLRAGMLSIVSVLTSLYPAGTVLLVRLVLKERTGVLRRVGLVLAAVVLIAGAPATG